MAKVKVVIVGAGRSGSKLMLRPLQVLGDRAEVVGICDPNEDLARQVAQDNGLSGYYKSLDEALEAETVDIVCVSTPPFTHFELSKQAMEKGCSVVVEKPLTNTIEEAQELKAVSEQTGKKLTVVHNHKFRPGIVRGVELFKAGVTGTLLHVHVNWVTLISNRLIGDPECWVHKVKGGAFKEVLPHILYNTYPFVGEMKLVDVRFGKRVKERHWMPLDEAVICMESEVCPVTVHVSFNGERELRRVAHPVCWTLQGSKGVLCTNHERSYVPYAGGVLCAKQTIADVVSAVKDRFFTDGTKRLSDHGHILLKFIDHVQKGTPSPVSWDEAIHVMALTDQICDEAERLKAKKGME